MTYKSTYEQLPLVKYVEVSTMTSFLIFFALNQCKIMYIISILLYYTIKHFLNITLGYVTVI